MVFYCENTLCLECQSSKTVGNLYDTDSKSTKFLMIVHFMLTIHYELSTGSVRMLHKFITDLTTTKKLLMTTMFNHIETCTVISCRQWEGKYLRLINLLSTAQLKETDNYL